MELLGKQFGKTYKCSCIINIHYPKTNLKPKTKSQILEHSEVLPTVPVCRTLNIKNHKNRSCSTSELCPAPHIFTEMAMSLANVFLLHQFGHPYIFGTGRQYPLLHHCESGYMSHVCRALNSWKTSN